MTDRLKRAAPEAVGELQGGPDPTGFAARLETGPIPRREVGLQLRRHPQASPLEQYLLAQSYSMLNLPDWTADAACAGGPTSDWFTDEVADTSPLDLPDTAYAAMMICADCPVREPCLGYAYEMEERPWSESTGVDADRFGIYAVPGRIRERFARRPDRIAAGLAWLDSVAASDQRRWKAPLEEGETA